MNSDTRAAIEIINLIRGELLNAMFEVGGRNPLYDVCKQRVDALDMAIDALLGKDSYGWISVDDRLPDNSEDVLVTELYNERRIIRIGWCLMPEKRWTVYTANNGRCWSGNVTHWMPISVPPKED